MAKPDADDRQLWKVLEQVRLADFLRQENGLDTELKETASNFPEVSVSDWHLHELYFMTVWFIFSMRQPPI